MRLIEALLLLVMLTTYLALAVARLRARGIARVLAPAALVTAGVQLAVEGGRWQMAPAYAVTGSLCAICLAHAWARRSLRPRVHASRVPDNSRLRRLGARSAIGMGAVAVAFSAALPVAFPVFHFPIPSGSLAVGTLTYHWMDSSRLETFTTDAGDRRELMVQVWYPAQASASSSRTPYVADGSVLAPVARLLHLPGFFFSHLKYITTNATPGALVAGDAAQYPVLIFSPGRAGFRQHNTFQIEELVSRGYVVAAIDHAYAAAGVEFPDGRRAVFDTRLLERKFMDGVIPYLAQDVSFALDKLATLNGSDPNGILTGRLDLQRAGIFGVSLGGIIAAQACLMDNRLRACLAMDAPMPTDVVRQGLEQPTMWIGRDAATMRHEGWAEEDIHETQNTMRSVFARLPSDGYLVLVPGMFHANFSDFPFLCSSALGTWLGFTGPIVARRAHEIINAYSVAFFDRHLNGKPGMLLNGPSARFADVRLQTRPSRQHGDARGDGRR